MSFDDWIAALRKECAARSQRAVATELGYSQAMISQVVGGKYPGDARALQNAVRGRYMNAVVDCPILGEIGAHKCQDWRAKAKKFTPSNNQRVQMYRACSNCPRNGAHD